MTRSMIYLDHSATTPVDKKVLEKMLPFFSADFGNASSVHSMGQKAGKAVSESRNIIAEHLHCMPEEIFFTSGATESNNLAINGFAQKIGFKNLHLISDMVEHQAVLAPIAQLNKQGVDSTILGVGKDGKVDIKSIEKAVQKDTRFISIMFANSEVGCVNDIRAIGDMIRKLNKSRDMEHRIYFHTDATQAMNFYSVNIEELKVDFLSFSGHKIYGPKGVGALYVRRDTPLSAIMLGGSQEKNMRSGTLNVPGIIGLGSAVQLLTNENIKENNESISKLRNLLRDGITRIFPNVRINTDINVSTPAHLNISFPGIPGEAILTALDLAGICVSTGSACSSKKASASHVLVAMGVDVEIARSTIRFTLGKSTTLEQIEQVLNELEKILNKFK